MLRLKFIDRIPAPFRNKYLLTVVVFLTWILLFDSNNLISRYKEMRQMRKLRAEREYYMERIETERRKLYELKTDNRNLEKFAREQYHMKRPDEDLFIVLTPSEDRKITRRNK